MHSLRHPNQVRSACERCRKQKLKCSRPTIQSAPCSRCNKLGLACQTGIQRRVGRPSKKDGPAERVIVAEVLEEGLLPAQSGDSQLEKDKDTRQEDAGFLDSLEWILLDDSGFLLDNAGGYELPNSPTIPTPFHPTSATEPPFTQMSSATIIHLTSESHFSSLSKVNKEIHSYSEKMSRQPSQGTLESFVRDIEGPNGSSGTLRPYQYLMKLLQDYLQAIKSLHRSLDHNSRIIPVNWPEISIEGSSHCAIGSQPRNFTDGRLILDSPTALLVISCFSQLLQHVEAVFMMSQNRLGKSSGHMASPGIEVFAGIPIVEFLTQGAMFVEMIKNVFGQIIVVLGIPTGTWWSGKSMWTGLLVEKKYRDMLNQELGSVADEWSTRPSELMEMITACGIMINDASLFGC